MMFSDEEAEAGLWLAGNYNAPVVETTEKRLS
jgi:hypothetical protein